MGKHILVQEEVTIEFGRALDLAVSNYCKYNLYDHGERIEIEYKLLREILRDIALEQLRQEGSSLPGEYKKIETMIIWDTLGFVVEVAWIKEDVEDYE